MVDRTPAFLRAFSTGLLMLAAAAPIARAELVIFTNGQVVKAISHQAAGDQIEIRLPGGGSFSVYRTLVERIVDDEVAGADVQPQVQNEKSKQLAPQPEKRKELAEKNKKEGEAFLAGNMKKERVVTLPSGLQYKVLKVGDGKKPTDDDIVECHYRGTGIDGTEFDSSYGRGRPATFRVTGVIPGWREAMKLMPVGSKWQLFVPSELAYGEPGLGVRKGSGRASRAGGPAPPEKIGPNATLILEVELLAIKGPASAVE